MAIERDFRKLAPATQAELRRVAVAMVRAGRTRIEAAETVGVNRRFVGQWVKTAEQAGEAALAGRHRGRRPGEQKALSAAQEEGLRSLIAWGCPDRFGLSFALWTRQAVRALIVRETGVWLTLPVVGRYLRAWGFTAQRPMRRAAERREEAVRAWLESTYPAIVRKAKTQGCEIHWADETGLSNQANYGRSFAPRGQTPILRRPARRFSQSMISSLTNQGKLRFMVYQGALNTTIFLNFLRRLIGETIELKVLHGRDLGQVKADQGQLEQVIINLAVNARDAMPAGGTLSIETKAPAEEPGVVHLRVADTGVGIPPAVLARIGEPFFTTKPDGTGLGLAVTYTVVREHGGTVSAQSEAGRGTAFTVSLPMMPRSR